MRNKIIMGLIALTIVSGAMPALAQSGERYAQNTASAGQPRTGNGPMIKMLGTVEDQLHLEQGQRAAWQDYRNALLHARPPRPEGRKAAPGPQGEHPQARDGQRPLMAEMLAQGPLHGTQQEATLKRAAANLRASLSPEQIERVIRAEGSMPKPSNGGRPEHPGNG